MMKANPPGAPHKLSPEKYKLVVEQVEKDISLSNAARVARVHFNSVKNWLEYGARDYEKGEDTIFVQFLFDVREAQGKKISELLHSISKCKKNWQALAWLLEKCCFEDFGKDSEVYKHLLEDYKQLLNDLVELKKGKK